MDWLVSLEKVGFSFNDRVLFDSINLLISNHELHYIEGHNGCGKTTLLRIFSGLIQPTQGLVHYNHSKHDIKSQHYLGHALAIKSYLTVCEQVKLSPHFLKLDRLQELLAIWSLSSYEHILCEKLSAGQLKRLALIILILNKKKLWILDEPYNALDKHACGVLDQFIIEHVSGGGAVIMTSHTTPSIDYNIKHYKLG